MMPVQLKSWGNHGGGFFLNSPSFDWSCVIYFGLFSKVHLVLLLTILTVTYIVINDIIKVIVQVVRTVKTFFSEK